MADSLEKQLADIQGAMSRVRTVGQSGRVGDLEFVEANLSGLQAQEKELLKRMNRRNGKRPQIKRIRIS